MSTVSHPSYVLPAAICSSKSKINVGSEVRIGAESTDTEKREIEEVELRNAGLAIINYAHSKDKSMGKLGIDYENLNDKERSYLNLEQINAHNSHTHYIISRMQDRSNGSKISYNTSVERYFGPSDAVVHKDDSLVTNKSAEVISKQEEQRQRPSEIVVSSELTSQLLEAYRSQARRVQVFTGFARSAEGKPFMKRPLFSFTDSLTRSGHNYLCRMEPLGDSNLDYITSKMRLPVHNEYFLVTPDRVASSADKNYLSTKSTNYFRDNGRSFSINEQEYVSVGSSQSISYPPASYRKKRTNKVGQQYG